MRITKKIIADAKRGMRRRITELCAMGATGKIKDELQRVFPIYLQTPTPGEEWECMRHLLFQLLDDAIPAHWHE